MFKSFKNNRKRIFIFLGVVLISFSLIMAYHNVTGNEENNSAFKRLVKSGKRSFSAFEGISIKKDLENDTVLNLKAENIFWDSKKKILKPKNNYI